MKVAILGSRSGWHEARLAEALRTRGVETVVAPITALAAAVPGTTAAAAPAPKTHEGRLAAGGIRLDDCAAVIVRAIPAGSLEQVIFRVDALHRLARLGVAVINSPRCIERTVDKYFTSALLEDAGLPTPRTRVCERLDDALAAFEALGGDVVIKPLFGSEGRGIVRVTDADLAYRTCRALEVTRSVFYLQEFVPHGGRDIRAFVVGGRLVAAMTRRAAGWKTNVSQGARTEPVVLSGALERLSLQAAGLLEADYAGVDLLQAEDGRTLVIEVNGIPGWRGLQQTTRVDVAAVIAECATTRRARPAGPDQVVSRVEGHRTSPRGAPQAATGRHRPPPAEGRPIKAVQSRPSNQGRPIKAVQSDPSDEGITRIAP
jgi:RimK family alpha-L-glutamate ligase